MNRILIILAAVPTVLLGASPAAAATITPKTRISLHDSVIRVGETTVISGHVSGHLRHKRVYLQQHSATGWHRYDHTRLTSSSRYRFTIRPGNLGWHTFRVVSPSHRHVAHRSVSRSVHLLVKPRRHRHPHNCTPGYSPCIPPGPDVDCAGGSGNGPRYVDGPVYVTGSDPYGLDSDGDGIGCES